MQLVKTSPRNGGYAEAGQWALPAITNPMLGASELILCDASSQVPNLRASELYMAAWTGLMHPEATIVTDVLSSGTIGSYAGLWGPYEANDRVIARWQSFYGTYRLKLLSLAPFLAARLKQGPVVAQRERALDALIEALDVDPRYPGKEIRARIKTLELFDVCKRNDVRLSDIAASVPKGKTVGMWTCPCCGERLALRLVKQEPLVTNTRDERPGECRGAEIVQSRLTLESKITMLIKMLGIEIALLPSLRIHELASEKQSLVMVRDYSDPRGTIRRIIDRYGEERVRLTSRIYVRGGNGEEASGHALIAYARKNPSAVVDHMLSQSLLSKGDVLSFTLP